MKDFQPSRPRRRAARPLARGPWIPAALIFAGLLAGCTSTANPEDRSSASAVSDSSAEKGPQESREPQDAVHIGPAVVEGNGGPGRFVQVLYDDFEVDRTSIRRHIKFEPRGSPMAHTQDFLFVNFPQHFIGLWVEKKTIHDGVISPRKEALELRLP